jgi:hypothetical protein
MANVENMGLWAGALRSGDYEQGANVLHNVDNNTWCCLGVACDVAIKNGVQLGTKIEAEKVQYSDEEKPTGRVTNFGGAVAFLPYQVIDWLDVDSNNPKLCDLRATWLNDIGNRSFNEIADLIDTECGLAA